MSALPLGRLAAATLPVLALAILIGLHSNARAQSDTDNECFHAFLDSFAADYCTGNLSATTTAFGNVNCSISLDCGITVSVDGRARSWAPLFSSSASPDSVRTLDVCFDESASHPYGFVANVEYGCSSSQTTGREAVATGLSTE